MKAYLTQLLQTAPNPLVARHITREYLQARILGSLQHMDAMVSLAFHGGTALRFLYNIPRYSEDLDFALERSANRYDFRIYLRTIQSDFAAENYQVALRIRDDKVVHSAFVRFQGLLYELGLSPHANEVLSIKIEVDTQPPAGANMTTTIVQRYGLLNLYHYDRGSLLAGKLHAILQRPFTKGRDFYDLFWYLATPDWPEPNLSLLNHALVQTEWPGKTVTAKTWRSVIEERLHTVDWKTAVTDVQPFLMNPHEVSQLTPENIVSLLTREETGI